MTIVSNDRRKTYRGNGVTTAFTGPRAFSASHIHVYTVVVATGVATELTTGFTVSGVGLRNTTVTLDAATAAALTDDYDLLVLRTVLYEQDTDITNQGAYLPKTAEEAHDKVVQQVQQLADAIARSLRVADTAVGVDPISDPETGRFVITVPGGFGVSDTPPLGDLTLRTDLNTGSAIKGATLVKFLDPTPDAVERTVADELAEVLVNIRRFFAVDRVAGVTDDTAALEAAAGTGGRRVFLPADDYVFQNVNLPDNTVLFGEGSSSVLRPLSAVGTQLMLRCDANQNIEIRDLKLEVDKATYPTMSCIWGQGCSNVKVHHVELQGGGNFGIHFVDGTEISVEQVSVSSCASGGIFISATTQSLRCKVLNSIVAVAGSTLHGISIQRGVRCQVRGNSVNESGCFGIQFSQCTYSTMSGNTAYNTGREAFNASSTTYSSIENNIGVWDGVAGTDYGISIAAVVSDCSLNKIAGNIIVNSNKSGIAVASVLGFNCNHNSILGNTVYNPNILNEAHGSGILLYGPGTIGTLVMGNKLYGGGTMKYGVYDLDVGGKPLSSNIRGNHIVNAVTGKVNRNTASAPSMEADNGLTFSERSWVPVITVTAGAFGVAPTVNHAYYYEHDDKVSVKLSIENTNNGTGATEISITLPFTASANGPFCGGGRDTGVHGGSLVCRAAASATTVNVRKADGTYPWGTGSTIDVWLEFERAT